MQYTRARENAFSAMAFRARRRRRRFAVRIADHVGGPREIKVAKRRGVEVHGGSQYSIIDRTRIADERPAFAVARPPRTLQPVGRLACHWSVPETALSAKGPAGLVTQAVESFSFAVVHFIRDSPYTQAG